MDALRVGVGLVWLLFWIGWIGSAFTAGRTASRGQGWRGRVAIWVLLILIFRVFRPVGLEIHSVAVATAGAVVFVLGLLLAIWARVHLGRNWGMPTSMRAEPELVTSGPYRWIRHPIYTGLIVAFLGTTFTINVLGLLVVVLITALFYWSARVEERNMTTAFPSQYPEYMARSKMLIPWVL